MVKIYIDNVFLNLKFLKKGLLLIVIIYIVYQVKVKILTYFLRESELLGYPMGYKKHTSFIGKKTDFETNKLGICTNSSRRTSFLGIKTDGNSKKHEYASHTSLYLRKTDGKVRIMGV